MDRSRRTWCLLVPALLIVAGYAAAHFGHDVLADIGVGLFDGALGVAVLSCASVLVASITER